MVIVPILTAICFVLSVITFTATAHYSSPANCSRTCGATGPGSQTFQYPFGFSPGCPIQLTCSPNGTISIGDFPVQSVTRDTIIVTIAAQCKRPIRLIEQLYGPHFAPTSENAILLNNCKQPSSCLLPSTMVNTTFESICDNSTTNSSMSCYSGQSDNSNGFINLSRLNRLKCQYLLSSISAEMLNNISVSLDVQMIQLGWWLTGDCNCSKNAVCTTVKKPPSGEKGYRCYCKDGFAGDGFLAGTGCRRDTSTCNPAKYLSGRCGGKTRIIVLVGGVVAGASLMISLGLVCCFLRRSQKMRSLNNAKRRLSEATSVCTIPVYPYKEIERATNYFAEKQRLGTGAYGTVYAGKLHGDEWVAIKRIKHRDTDSIEQVMNEIRLLSSVSHPNLVRLLGCSIEHGEQVLVYEFMPNGTLCQHLQGERGDGLDWAVRLAIATETAQAIAHLHSAEPPIYHRDVKSSNILLDYSYKSKVADFGLSRLGMPENSHISTAPQGTPGYLDPQYHQNFHLSDKSDVYSFGVVLVEIITSLKVVDFTRRQNEVNLANLATDRIGQGRLDDIIDPSLEPSKDAWTLSSIRKVAELAFRCLAFHRDSRPSMAEVAVELEQIRISRWCLSEEISNGRSVPEALSSRSILSSSSSMNEKLLNGSVKSSDRAAIVGGDEMKSRANSQDSTESVPVTENSPDSLHDSWSSEDSSPSPSSNRLLNNDVIK